MFRAVLACVLLLAIAPISVLAAGPEAEVKGDESVICPMTFPAPVVDGKLDDACWKRAPQIPGMMFRDSFRPASPQTSVSLAYDDKGIYIAFRCAEPEMSKLVGSNAKEIWLNDSLEIYIDADRDRSLAHHFLLDAQGRKFQERMRDGNAFDREWPGPWDAAVVQGANEWTAEVFVPWKAVDFEYEPGAAIRANFGRNRRVNGTASAWYATPDGFNKPLRFGNVFLGQRRNELKGFLAFTGHPKAGKAEGWLLVENQSLDNFAFVPSTQVFPSTGSGPVNLAPIVIGGIGSATSPLKLDLPESRLYNVDIYAQEIGGRSRWLMNSYQVKLPIQTPGSILGSYDWGTLWQSNATFKVMADTELPTSEGKAVEISAARNEYEPFQIVLAPNRELENLRVSVGDLTGAGSIPAGHVTVKLVETVPVTIPTSPDCVIGDWPDPLVPFKTTSVPAGKPASLWLTVYVPTDAKPGDYSGTVTLEAEGIEPVRIPVKLHVWDFALPKVSNLRTAYGGDAATLAAWHGVTTIEDQRKIADLLNQDFIEHRMSPYSPMAFRDPNVEVSGDEVKVDWTEFDKGAEKFMPWMNGFNLPYAWMSDFFGTKPGTPEYRKLKRAFLKNMAAHLKEKGWLEKGYAYIYDEPEPDAYQKIVDDAKMWHDADPDYRVLLTEQPEKPLAGEINIYVPILPNYNEVTCPERQKVGDQVWWYVCCWPHHPYPGNFIDYPAIDHRILHWMNWKYGVTGVLYWTTTWWQDNPWTTPMSYTPDHSGKWGNGDGHLLYPAVREKSKTPLLAGPVDSIRWEMIREGVEDYDYFFMLDQAIKKCEASRTKSAAVAEGKKALAQVDSLVRGRTDYEKDPMRLYAARAQVAEALEKLAD